MKVRADLHVNGAERSVQLLGRPEEPAEHLAHKLAAAVLFFDEDPVLGAGMTHDFVPDLLARDEAGEIKLWVDCGSTTLHKLDKLVKRLPYARVIVLKEDRRSAERLRKDAPSRVEILSWPDGAFKNWCARVGEKNEVYGEGGGLTLNVVLNDHPVVVEFTRF